MKVKVNPPKVDCEKKWAMLWKDDRIHFDYDILKSDKYDDVDWKDLPRDIKRFFIYRHLSWMQHLATIPSSSIVWAASNLNKDKVMKKYKWIYECENIETDKKSNPPKALNTVDVLPPDGDNTTIEENPKQEISIKDLKGWTKKLTKAEKKHLRETAGVRDTYGLKRTLEYTAAEAKKKNGMYCHECYRIGKKLGVI